MAVLADELLRLEADWATFRARLSEAQSFYPEPLGPAVRALLASEHAAAELFRGQTPDAFMRTTRCSAVSGVKVLALRVAGKSAGREGVYHVIYSFEDEQVGRRLDRPRGHGRAPTRTGPRQSPKVATSTLATTRSTWTRTTISGGTALRSP